MKLEFVGGRIRRVDDPRTMAGGRLDHGAIQFGLAALLKPLADARGCRGFSSDVRVKVKANGQSVFPGLSFAGAKGEREGQSLLNPTLVVEVLSPSTADYDRGDKWELYQSIDSLEEYLMVHSESVRVERYRRRGKVWLDESVRGLDALIEVLGGRVALYQGVELGRA